ncbi:unnamed protein product [Cuscuta campestris]|uniref:Uncharacterized protein n=1 Tax=Cuscuta campestris TaxID=132261 RepID=A0A484NRA5_9ASTE|nr:unnamed protein product [Cuscuta campestris]
MASASSKVNPPMLDESTPSRPADSLTRLIELCTNDRHRDNASLALGGSYLAFDDGRWRSRASVKDVARNK